MNLSDYEYFRTPNGVLYNADCLTIMPMLEKVDLVLTDPPYGIHDKISAHGNARNKGNLFAIKYDQNPWDMTQPPPNAFKKIFALSNNQIIFGGNYFVQYLPISRGWVFWDKMGDGMSSVNPELIFTSYDQSIKIFRRCHGMDKGFMLKDRFCGVHPTQKPTALIIWLLNEYAQKVHSILDPFAGSCTTAIACERLNRKWICIELDEKYCAISKRRLELELSQPRLPGGF